MEVRRVVTGRTPEGKSVVASDTRVPPITVSLAPDGAFHQVWGSDEIVKLPVDGDAPGMLGWFPPPGGFRFAFVTFGPEASAPPGGFDVEAGFREMAEKLPGLAEVLDPENPMMHTTPTVDFNLLVSGELWLELDDGVEVHLTAGDCVVQNGTRHAWHNRSPEPAVMAVALVGANQSG